MTEIKHTPTPWTIGRGKSGLSFGLFGDDGRQIASSSWHDSSPHYPKQETTAANFEFIAEAANSHASLTAERDRLREENERLRERGQKFANQVRHILYRLPGQEFASTVDQLSAFDAALSPVEGTPDAL